MEPIERLKAQRLDMIARLSQIEAVIHQHEELQRKVDELLGGDPKMSPEGSVRTSKSGASTESVTRRVTKDVAEFERAIRDILDVAQKPLNRTEIYQICLDRGIEVGGQEPLNTLASRLSRMKGVGNLKRKGYFLESRKRELTSGFIAPEPLSLQSIVDDSRQSRDEPLS